MLDVHEIRQKNPRAADEIDAMRETFETLRQLREAGVTKGDTFRPAPSGRRSLEDLKTRRTKTIFKVEDDA